VIKGLCVCHTTKRLIVRCQIIQARGNISECALVLIKCKCTLKQRLGGLILFQVAVNDAQIG
jgi:hypothetical protein